MTDTELLEELERRVETGALVPFSGEESMLMEGLSFKTRTLTTETFKDAWNAFVVETGVEALGWPVHFGVAVWHWEQEMRLHAASVFEHIHRDIRRGYDQAGEVEGYQAEYLPGMLQLYAELSDSERLHQLFGRLEELYEDGHIGISEYTDGLLAVIEIIGEHATADSISFLHSANKTIYDLRERLDGERREKEALRAETDTGVRFTAACARAEGELRARCLDLITFYPETQKLLVEAHAWTSTPFRGIGPAWSPILLQKALEHEFNERIWTAFRGAPTTLPSVLDHDRLTINQIKRLLITDEPMVKGIRVAICKRLKLTLDLSPALANALRKLVEHSTRARHGDRKAYTVADLNVCMKAISEGLTVLETISLFQPR